MKPNRWVLGSCLVLLTVVAYLPSLTSPFTFYDDPLYVSNNLERVAPPGWDGLKLQFDSRRAWAGDFVEFFPLRDTVYWGLYQGFALEPLPYHLASLIFHLITSLLVWLLLTQLGLTERSAWLGALLFALHPVHIESVVWIAGLKDPMYGMFMVAGLCAYASYRQRPATWKYLIVLGGLICGFLTKSLIVVMPVVMLGMDVLLPGPPVKWSVVAARLFGPFVVAGLFFLSIMGIGKANHVLMPPHGGTWATHAVLVVWAQAKYLKQALLPTTYRLIYCFEPPQGFRDWRLYVGVLVIVLFAALCWRWRKDPLRLFLMGFYVVAMLPVSNLLPFPAIMADRYLYVPTVATCGLLGLFSSRLSTRTFGLVTVAVALLLTASTASRAWVWQDQELLWEEPDLDPACMVDSAYPAADAHILRFLSTKDRHEGLLALERAMVTPGLATVGESLICTTLIGAAREAQALGETERTIGWAKYATTMCRNYSSAWNVAMVVNLHKRLDLAAGAAIKAWRLEKNPETEVLMWLTLLELGDARAKAEVLRLSRLDAGALAQWRLPPSSVCEKIAQFSSDVPRLAPALGEAIFNCAPVLENLHAAPATK